MQLRSTAFAEGHTIPRRYTQFAENISPPLEIVDVPEDAVTLVLTMDDPDVPPQAGVPVWDHWVALNIAPDVRHIPEGAGTVADHDHPIVSIDTFSPFTRWTSRCHLPKVQRRTMCCRRCRGMLLRRRH